MCLSGKVQLLLAAVVIAGSACSQKEPPEPPPKPANIPAPNDQPLQDSGWLDLPVPPEAGKAIARIRAVDLDRRPLPGLLPIATTQPNAFDKPIATGGPTATDGHGWVAVPQDRRVFVRAWDPSLRLYANNYIELPPGEGTVTEVQEVVMVPGATLEARLTAPDGRPIAHENVDLMLFHPTKGPWWPAQVDTDAEGNVRFPAVPAGRYTVKIKSAKYGEMELHDIALPPGGRTKLGTVTLQ